MEASDIHHKGERPAAKCKSGRLPKLSQKGLKWHIEAIRSALSRRSLYEPIITPRWMRSYWLSIVQLRPASSP